MIRERRAEDIEVLCEVLRGAEELRRTAGDDPRAWLEEHEAEVSWVFDMAPVSVAPTRNVVGHVQVHRLPDEPWVADLVAATGRPAADHRAIGRLFVRADTYERGIGRFFLREAVARVRGEGRLPVLVGPRPGWLTTRLCRDLGFEEVPADDGHGPAWVPAER